MNIIPWRLRAAISDRFPLLYHLAVNLVTPRRDASYWDARLADTWHQRTWPTKNELIAQRIPPDAAVLDVGCGNGGMLRDLKARGFKNLAGVEISEYAVQRLQKEGITMHRGRLPRLPLPDAQYDIVIASQVLEHIIRRNRFATEVGRVLRPDGQAFFFVPNDCLGSIDEPEHVIKYNRATFESLLRRHNDVLSLEVMKDANHTMFILVGHVRKRCAEALSTGRCTPRFSRH